MKNVSSRPGAVIIGNDFQAFGIVRSLVEKKISLFLVETELGIASFSRHTPRKARGPASEDLEIWERFLIDLAEKEKLHGWVLFANGDNIIKIMSKLKDRLEKVYRVPVPCWEHTKKIIDKRIAYSIVERAGVPVPRIYPSVSLEELLDLKPNYPLVLKPVEKNLFFTATKKKALCARNREELVAQYGLIQRYLAPGEFLIQEMIEGGTKNLFSYATIFDGTRSLAGIAAHRIRQHPMDFGKATTYAVSVDLPELETLAETALTALGYHGVAEVEFMYDEKTGSHKFIEVNGRIWGWHLLGKFAGVNFAYLLFQLLIGQEFPKPSARSGVCWYRLLTDMPTAVSEVLKGRLGLLEYLRSIILKGKDAVFEASDPLPFFMEFILLPYLWRKRGV